MQAPDLISQLRLMRDASAIERAHIKPHLMRYSNGQHTHDLISVLTLCWRADHYGQMPRAELLLKAHVHDMPELVTGDMPSPTKEALGEVLNTIDRNVERWLGMDFNLTAEEAWYLHAADKFELWLWCWDEHERGNKAFHDWIVTTNERWIVTPLPPAFKKLGMLVEIAGTVGHLTNAELKIAGGIS